MAERSTGLAAQTDTGAAAGHAGIAPYANDLDQVGRRRQILRVWQTAHLSRLGKQIEFMQFGRDGLRPLIWLQSVEYPMAPPWGFCVDASEKGFGVVSVRRPGFGGTSPVTSVEEEVSLLNAFLEEAGFENAVLIVEGTARPAGLRLAMENPRIAFTVLAKPLYFAASFGDLDPWFRDILLQALQTRAGAAVSLAAIQQIGRTAGYNWLYENIFRIDGDLSFVRGFQRDIAEAWSCLRSISADTFRMNLSALIPDPSLTPGCLSGLNAVAVIGVDTPEVWRQGFEARSEELGIKRSFMPKGSIFALHQNPDALLGLITQSC